VHAANSKEIMAKKNLIDLVKTMLATSVNRLQESRAGFGQISLAQPT
jgi:hypothetical protein